MTHIAHLFLICVNLVLSGSPSLIVSLANDEKYVPAGLSIAIWNPRNGIFRSFREDELFDVACGLSYTICSTSAMRGRRTFDTVNRLRWPLHVSAKFLSLTSVLRWSESQFLVQSS